jgi:integrase
MGRPRKHNKHLPRRVVHRHGAYHFIDKAGKWHRLGKTLPEMYRALAAFVERPEGLPRVRDLATRYRLEVLPKKAPHTQVDHGRYLELIEAVFGDMAPRDVRPAHLRQFHDRLRDRPTRANRALEVAKHLFAMGVQWGALDENPGRDVRKFPVERRRRYVTDADFRAVYERADPMIRCAMDLAVLTGLRRGDLLSLTRDHLTPEGIRIDTAKTGAGLLIEWSDELRAVVDRAWALGPEVRRHVIVTRRGKGYTPDGFSALFRRVLLRTPAEHRFRWHDLRAKSASDDTLEAAAARLGHASAATTVRHYRRAPAKVRPLR